MAVKTITITEKAYNTLKAMKKGDESFSEEINRIGEEKKSIFDFVGLLKHSEQGTEELQEKVRKTRKQLSESFERRHDNFRHISSS